MILDAKEIDRIQRWLPHFNDRAQRKYIRDFIETLEDASKQLTTARAEIARLELEVAGWRAAADRNRPKFVNSENKMCYCGGVGCLSCCGNE